MCKKKNVCQMAPNFCSKKMKQNKHFDTKYYVIDV